MRPFLPLASLAALILLAACATPPADSTAALADAVTDAPGDPLAEPVPVVRVVAGRADTLLVQDWMGADVRPVFKSHADVSVESLGDRFVVRARDGFSGVAAVPYVARGADLALPVNVSVEPEVTFTFTPDVTAASGAPEVFVIGGFNDWSRTADPLEDRGDGTLARTRPIAPGRYEYKLTVDGAEVLDPANAETAPNPFGDFNNILVVEPPGEGRLGLRLLPPFTEDQIEFEALRTDREGAAMEVDLEPEDVVALIGNVRIPDEAMEVHGTEFLIGLRPLPGMPDLTGHRVLRVAASAGGVASDWREVPLYNGLPLANAQAEGRAPEASGETETWHDQIIYQVVLDRFANGDPTNDARVDPDSVLAPAQYHGGDLAGLRQKLREGYFRDLGVTALWISPVYDNPNHSEVEFPPPHRRYTGYHGYWPIAPRKVDEHLGDIGLLREVVDEAHAQGLRVLLDFVANHTHEDHPYFRENRDWFGTLELPDGSLNLRRWDDYRLTTWFEPYLPSFDYSASPEAVEQMTADAVWWLKASGADGFRHDAVKHIPSLFWRRLTQRLHEELPDRDLFQIGETFGSHALVGSYVRPGQLDAQFEFNQYDAAISALARGGSLAALAGAVEEGLRQYGPLHLMGNLLNSHDKTRFLAILENDTPPEADAVQIGFDNPPVRDQAGSLARLELGLAYVLTVPGVPVLYYGDEIGMTGAADPDNRRDMRWGADVTPEERAHRARVSQLAKLRQRLPALRHGTYETIEASETLWVFRRDSPGQTVVVALNTGAEPVRFTAPPEANPASSGWGGARDAFDKPARVASDDGGLRFTVPAGGYRVLVR